MLLLMLDAFWLRWGPRSTSTPTVADQTPSRATVGATVTSAPSVVVKDTSTANVTGG